MYSADSQPSLQHNFINSTPSSMSYSLKELFSLLLATYALAYTVNPDVAVSGLVCWGSTMGDGDRAPFSPAHTTHIPVLSSTSLQRVGPSSSSVLLWPFFKYYLEPRNVWSLFLSSSVTVLFSVCSVSCGIMTNPTLGLSSCISSFDSHRLRCSLCIISPKGVQHIWPTAPGLAVLCA